MRYIIFFSYTGEAKKAMIANPGDRAAAIQALCDSAGGRLETLEFLFGDWDGYVTISVPDAESAAAISMVVSSTGSFARLETRQLVSPDEFRAALTRAGELSYRKPGD